MTSHTVRIIWRIIWRSSIIIHWWRWMPHIWLSVAKLKILAYSIPTLSFIFLFNLWMKFRSCKKTLVLKLFPFARINFRLLYILQIALSQEDKWNKMYICHIRNTPSMFKVSVCPDDQSSALDLHFTLGCQTYHFHWLKWRQDKCDVKQQHPPFKHSCSWEFSRLGKCTYDLCMFFTRPFNRRILTVESGRKSRPKFWRLPQMFSNPLKANALMYNALIIIMNDISLQIISEYV